ncbi:MULTISPECIES: antibiotic biosynthesis monooxygenase family protein [unclassified Halomonas]|uniref:antibiotic biosynthesis monooxygenase family protein n=1 Tax=unclassified Halomonas TaxID=2609666 RepID=UPI0020766B2E|nr:MULTISPECIES: antibiotic biosynthesis monooxygenase family protein [unclassified Halomonas]
MVKVIIERRIMPGLEQEYEQAAREAMRVSLGVSGFVSGETLVKIGQPDRRLMITKWRDLRAWKEWHQSEARARAMEQILPLLTEDETVQVFEAAL